MSSETSTPKIAPTHDPSALIYAGDAEIARKYDADHEGTPLFDTDLRFADKYINDGERVIDLGCGTGRAVLHFAERNCRVTGVDLSKPMLQLAAKKLDQHGYEARLIHADICELESFKDSEFDAGICLFSTLGLVRTKRQRLKTLRSWRRIIKPGGVLIIHAHNLWHNIYWPDGRRWLLKSFFSSFLPGIEFGDKWMKEYMGLEKMYIHVFRARELQKLIKRAGFELIEFMPLNITRTAEYIGKNPWLRANGFLMCCRTPK